MTQPTEKHENRTAITSLLNRVSGRLIMAQLWQQYFTISLILISVLIFLVAFIRLTAYLPDIITIHTLLLPFLVALPLSLLSYRKIDKTVSANQIDQNCKTQDLFLTAATIDNAQGVYKQLVLDKAACKASQLSAGQIITIPWRQKTATLAILCLIAGVTITYLPQCDPFERNKKRQAAKQRRQKLDNLHKATVQRLKVLKKGSLATNSPEVQDSINDLKTTFKNLKKNMRNQNMNQLKDMQSQLNRLWKKRNEERLQDLLKRRFAQQNFGSKTPEEQQMQKELAQGDSKRIQKALDRLEKQIRKLAKMKDCVAKRSQLHQLQKEMKKMANFLRQNAKSNAVQAALKRAMKQLDSACMNPNNKEALQNMADSLKLAKRELEKLGQNMRDIEKLEQALKAMQKANRLNNRNQLKELGDQNFDDLEDYEEFYNNLLNMACKGKKSKKGKNGIGGNGKKVDENPDAETANQPARVKGQLQAGQILAQWKIQEISKKGMVKEHYNDHIKQVKQGANEAILKEQVPPGYHHTIKNYFGSMKEPKKQ